MSLVVPDRVERGGASLQPLHDLGGLPARGGITRRGVLLRGPSVSDLSAADRARLMRLPLSARVDLRATFELAEAPEPDFGERVVGGVHVPLLDTDCPAAYRDLVGAALSEGGLPALYRLMARRGGTAVAAAVRVVLDNAEQGLASVVHCTSGRDRSGVVSAIVLSAVGVAPPSVAAQQARFCATRVIDLVADDAPVSPIEELLAFVDAEYGGAVGYLRRHGLDDDELAALRRALVA